MKTIFRWRPRVTPLSGRYGSRVNNPAMRQQTSWLSIVDRIHLATALELSWLCSSGLRPCIINVDTHCLNHGSIEPDTKGKFKGHGGRPRLSFINFTLSVHLAANPDLISLVHHFCESPRRLRPSTPLIHTVKKLPQDVHMALQLGYSLRDVRLDHLLLKIYSCSSPW